MTTALVKKCKWVFDKYKHLYQGNSDVDDDLNNKDQKQLASMIRHHKNSHISSEDWVSLYHQVKSKLETKETMIVDESFVAFLDSKFAETGLKKVFKIPELLEHLEVQVRKYYDNLLMERDEKIDEFSFEFFGCTQPADLTFYKKRFLPAALLYTYELKHPETDQRELMKDLFTIGSGAMTMDLSPEVTGLCMDCCQERVPEKTLNLMEVSRINLSVFIAQKADKFCSDMKRDSDTSEDEDSAVTKEASYLVDENLESLLDTKSDSAGGKLSVFEFNPFEVSLETSPDILVDESEIVRNHVCHYCQKAFSREEFVSLHIEILHESGKKVIPKFVMEGEEHITSFIEAKSIEVSTSVKEVQLKPSKRVAIKEQKHRVAKKVGHQAVKKAKLEASEKYEHQSEKSSRRQAVKKDNNQVSGKVTVSPEKSNRTVPNKIRKILTYKRS